VGIYALLLLCAEQFFTPLVDHATDSLSTLASFFILLCLIIVAGQLWLLFTPTRLAAELIGDRLSSLRRNFQTHTMRSLVEICSFVGVSCCTATAYRDLLYGLKCGSVTAVAVVILGELAVRSIRKMCFTIEGKPKPEGDENAPLIKPGTGPWSFAMLDRNFEYGNPQTAKYSTIVVPLAMVSGYAVILLLNAVYHHYENIMTAFILSIFAGVAFIVAGELLVLCSFTYWAGQVVISRAGNLPSIAFNWTHHRTRSAVELALWFVGMFGFLRQSGSMVVAINMSTMCMVFFVLVSEYVNGGRSVETAEQLKVMDIFERRKTLTIWLMLGYIGFCSLNLINDHLSSIVTLWLLTIFAMLAFVLAGELFISWEPTRSAGIILQQRVVDTIPNWRHHFLRSFVELGCWSGVTCGTFALTDDIPTAINLGTLSGIFVILAGEIIFENIKVRLHFPVPATKSSANDQRLRSLAATLPLQCLLCYFGGEVYCFLSAHYRSRLHTAIVLATLAGIGFVVVAQLCTYTSYTQRAGLILTERVAYTVRNWRQRFYRSLFEVLLWLGSTYFTYFLTQDLNTSAKVGTMVGVLVVLSSEVLHAIECMEHPPPAGEQLTWNMITAAVTRPFLYRPKTDEPLPEYSRSEVRKHRKRGDAWLIIHGFVYDISDFERRHPGGEAILKFAGCDASDQFEAFHRPAVARRLRVLVIGRVDDRDDLPITKAYVQLRSYLWTHGYFVSDKTYYLIKHAYAYTILLFLLVVFACGTCLDTSVQPGQQPAAAAVLWSLRCILSPLLIAFFLQQSAFLAHDSLHHCILEPRAGRRLNWLGWFHGSVVFGMSHAMWFSEHIMHHAMTMRVHSDPQFRYLPIFLRDAKELDAWRCHWLERLAARVLVPLQHWTLIPLAMVGGRVKLQIRSLIWCIRNRHWYDLVGMLLHFAWTTPFYVLLHSRTERLVFLFVSHVGVGVLHVQLLLSHLAVEVFEEEEEHSMQFCQFQIRTSRNLRADLGWHWFHGGLEYQIEHHLFPQLPRHNLSRVQPLVHALATAHGVTYRIEPLPKAIGSCLRHLRSLSRALDPHTAAIA
jgi:delta8-fatty-acid desaturase